MEDVVNRLFARVLLAVFAVIALAGCGGDSTPRPELIVNGDFEDPVVPAGSRISYTTPISGWTPVDNTSFYLLNNFVSSEGRLWQGYDWKQFVELDGNNGIYQAVTTTPGQTYLLLFAYSPQPGVSEDSNRIDIYINDVFCGYVAFNGVGMVQTWWETYGLHFKADGASATIKFVGYGAGDGFGGFIDDVKFL